MELVLLIHGIGMLSGVYFVATQPSWFSKMIGEKPAMVIGIALWLVAGLALVATAWALYQNLGWWQAASYVALVSDIAALAVWYNAVPGGALFGGALSSVIILYLLLTK